MGMSLRSLPGTLCLLLVVAACARTGEAGTPEADGVPPAPAQPGQQRYRAVGTVLENAQHGPQLCFSVAQSLPPQCGGADMLGWDWTVLDATTLGGVTWDTYVVTGTWDGSALTLTEAPRTATRADVRASTYEIDVSTPCDPPAGGWAAQPSGTEEEIPGVQAAAGRVEGYGGLWVDSRTVTGTTIVNVTTTGDSTVMESAVRRVWAGPLCVSATAWDEATLRTVQQALLLRPGLLGSGVDTRAGVVRVQVYVATPESQAAMDAEFGAGVVVVEGLLQPVP